MVVPATLLISLGLALLTNRKLPFMKFYRGALFLPMVTSTVAIAFSFYKTMVPNLFGARDWFCEKKFFFPHGPGLGGGGNCGLVMIQVYYIYCALYFYGDYMSST